MITLTRPEIEALIDLPAAANAIEDAYRKASEGRINLPPVGHITFPCNGDCHIKYGHMQGDRDFVIKIATGFPHNQTKGLASGNGLVLVLSAQTGAVKAMLHDEMLLTDIRTGLGGAIASRSLARTGSKTALVIGTGQQAYRQIEAHSALVPALLFVVWGRDDTKVAALVADLASNIGVQPVTNLEAATRAADIVITAIGSTSPILQPDWVEPGTHITAVGADTPGKQELETALVARADLLVVDLAAQSVAHGEIFHAAKNNLVRKGDLEEIGSILNGIEQGRTNNFQITIADLTGIAAQDIAIANVVLAAFEKK